MIHYIEIDARNVLLEPVDAFIEKLLAKAENPFVQKYIKTTLRNYFIEKWPNARRVRTAPANSPEWLKKALSKNEEVYRLSFSKETLSTYKRYVQFLNTLPVRDIKISPMRLPESVKKWEEALKAQKMSKSETEIGIDIVRMYSDGFAWVQVYGEDALNREGKLMNHCVGNYYDEVSNGKTAIYSLRDSKNKPHCTIEISNNVITQIKGNSNGPVKPEYRKYVKDVINKKRLPFSEIDVTDLQKSGFMLFEGKLKDYDIFNLPDEYTAEFLNISNIGKKIYLPSDMKIEDTCTIDNCTLVNIGQNSSVPTLKISNSIVHGRNLECGDITVKDSTLNGSVECNDILCTGNCYVTLDDSTISSITATDSNAWCNLTLDDVKCDLIKVHGDIVFKGSIEASDIDISGYFHKLPKEFGVSDSLKLDGTFDSIVFPSLYCPEIYILNGSPKVFNDLEFETLRVYDANEVTFNKLSGSEISLVKVESVVFNDDVQADVLSISQCNNIVFNGSINVKLLKVPYNTEIPDNVHATKVQNQI